MDKKRIERIPKTVTIDVQKEPSGNASITTEAKRVLRGVLKMWARIRF